MSILINGQTRVLVQGITGAEGSFWTQHMIDMGTNVVAGVTPGHKVDEVCGVKVYNTVKEATANVQADASMLFVPPAAVYDGVMESLAAGIKLIVTIAENIPLHETVKIRAAANAAGAMVIGGNTSGMITPGQGMMGCFPYWIERVYKPGSVGVMTRSGSLTNEVTAMIVEAGFGVSTLIGVGGDTVPATRFAQLLPFYEKDEDTKAVVIIGELGGTMEEEVAQAIEEGKFTKPLVAFLGGRTAPEGKRMGHAGAIISNGTGSVAHKIACLEAVGVSTAKKPREVGTLLQKVLQK